MALGQIGARMATTPGSLLQAASTGIAEALPGVRSASAERRGEERAARQALVAEERLSNREVSEEADRAVQMMQNYNTLEQALQDRNFRNLWENMGSADRRYVAEVAAAAGVTSAGISAAAQRFSAITGAAADERRFNTQVNQMVDAMISPGGSRYAEYVASPNKDAFIAGLRTSLGAGTVDLGSY